MLQPLGHVVQHSLAGVVHAPGFTLLGKSHSLSLLASAAVAVADSPRSPESKPGAVKPRESVQVAFTVIGPAGAPVVFSVPVLPSPEIVPPLAVQLLTVTGTLSGLVQVQVMVAGVPA